MTCFWDALRQQLNFNKDNYSFIEFLKNKNNKNNNVTWNNEKLTKKQIEENYEHIRDFEIKSIHKGYDCSVCDYMQLYVQLYLKWVYGGITHNLGSVL